MEIHAKALKRSLSKRRASVILTLLLGQTNAPYIQIGLTK